MSPWTSPSIWTSPLEIRLPLIVRSGPMTEGALRSDERASPMGRDEAEAVGGVLAGAKLGLTLGGSVSDLLKFGNICVHLCSDATTATVRVCRSDRDQAASAAEIPLPLPSSKHKSRRGSSAAAPLAAQIVGNVTDAYA